MYMQLFKHKDHILACKVIIYRWDVVLNVFLMSIFFRIIKYIGFKVGLHNKTGQVQNKLFIFFIRIDVIKTGTVIVVGLAGGGGGGGDTFFSYLSNQFMKWSSRCLYSRHLKRTKRCLI